MPGIPGTTDLRRPPCRSIRPASCSTDSPRGGRPPFSKEVPDGELWLPSSKQAVVDTLLEALDEHASVVLVGEPGIGKTCVLRALRHRIPAAGFRLTYCHNATLGRRDFYRQLCHAVGLSPAATAGSLVWESVIRPMTVDVTPDKLVEINKGFLYLTPEIVRRAAIVAASAPRFGPPQLSLAALQAAGHDLAALSPEARDSELEKMLARMNERPDQAR